MKKDIAAEGESIPTASTSLTIKKIKNFYCPRLEANVFVEYTTDIDHQTRQASSPNGVLTHPDCDRKDQCGIARQENTKTVYDWSLCANPELRSAHRSP